MPIGVVIIAISHEEIRHDFLLYQAENHAIIVVKPALEEGTKTFHPQFPVFIVPVFDYEVKPFSPRNTRNIVKKDPKKKTRCLSCHVSALEQVLASVIRKPPKRRFFEKGKPALRAGFFIFSF